MMCLRFVPAMLLMLTMPVAAETTVVVHDPLRDAAEALAKALVPRTTLRDAKVVEVDETTTPVEVYLALAPTSVVTQGQVFELRQRGEPIELDGEVIGYKETPIGAAEVTRVQGERLCVAKVIALREGQKPASGQVATPKTVPTRLAVLPFLRPDQAGMQLGTELADRLAVALTASGKFQVVERDQFQRVMGELGLGLSDLYDPNKTAPFGEQLQAGGVVLGTIGMNDTAFSVTLRVVDIATGAQTASAQVPILRSEELVKKYAPVVRRVDNRLPPGPDDSRPSGSGQVKVLYIGTDKDFVHNEQLVEYIKQAGFQVDVKPAMPESVSSYDVLVIESEAVANSGVGDLLYGHVGAGRGVVLTGNTLKSVLERGSSSITRWQGCCEAVSTWGGWGRRIDNPSLQLARSSPFNALPGVSVGTEVFSAKGRMDWAGTEAGSLESTATAIAQIVNGDNALIVAYANVFGPKKGKVYFQALSYSPNHPQVHQLFIGGIAWAAGLVDIDGNVPAGQ